MSDLTGVRDLPKTFEAVKAMIPPKMCSACGKSPITHTVNLTTTELAEGRGTVILRLKAEVCEPCGATINLLFRRAAKV